MIQVINISKRYGNISAVEKVSFEVQNSEVVALVGPNGAGKSTIMRCIAGLIRPEDGEIYVNGLDIQKRPVDSKQIIGYLPENLYIYDNLTAREFLYFISDIKKVINKESVVEEYLKIFELLDRADTLISTFSYGMKRKVGLISALLNSPKILILDEPISGIDPVGIFQIKKIIQRCKSNGCSILISTHILEWAELICDYILILNKGKLVTSFSPKEAKNKGELENLFFSSIDDTKK